MCLGQYIDRCINSNSMIELGTQDAGHWGGGGGVLLKFSLTNMLHHCLLVVNLIVLTFISHYSLLEPKPVYKMFPRQKMTLEFALNCYQVDSAIDNVWCIQVIDSLSMQSVGIFSFESEEFGREGQRRYIVATYYDLGNRYL